MSKNYYLYNQLTAIKSLHEVGFVHKEVFDKNVVFGFEKEPQDGKMRLKDVTYESDFYLIGEKFKQKSNIFIKKLNVSSK